MACFCFTVSHSSPSAVALDTPRYAATSLLDPRGMFIFPASEINCQALYAFNQVSSHHGENVIEDHSI
jgi:hypothetical protein